MEKQRKGMTAEEMFSLMFFLLLLSDVQGGKSFFFIDAEDWGGYAGQSQYATEERLKIVLGGWKRDSLFNLPSSSP